MQLYGFRALIQIEKKNERHICSGFIWSGRAHCAGGRGVGPLGVATRARAQLQRDPARRPAVQGAE